MQHAVCCSDVGGAACSMQHVVQMLVVEWALCLIHRRDMKSYTDWRFSSTHSYPKHKAPQPLSRQCRILRHL